MTDEEFPSEYEQNVLDMAYKIKEAIQRDITNRLTPELVQSLVLILVEMGKSNNIVCNYVIEQLQAASSALAILQDDNKDNPSNIH